MPQLIRLFLSVVALELLSWGAVPGVAVAQETDQEAAPQIAGLMWNRTGLPAVFPLQVKSPIGRDYVLTLVDDETGVSALAAYINGGAFFRVLVPPGTFRVRFAAGTDWRGEEALFGPGALTETFDLEQPLTFEVRNPGIKAGHLIDLSLAAPGQMARAETAEQFLCQTVRWLYDRWPVANEIALGDRRSEKVGLLRSWHGQLRFPKQLGTEGVHPESLIVHRALTSHRSVRSRVCG